MDSGSINPHQLFLVFNELVEAEADPRRDGFDPAYMIDQSHNVTDPVESMLSSAEAIAGALAKAVLVEARLEAGGAADPVALYRATGWRERKAQERRAVGLGAGIV